MDEWIATHVQFAVVVVVLFLWHRVANQQNERWYSGFINSCSPVIDIGSEI